MPPAEQKIFESVIEFTEEIQSLLFKGKTLKEISEWSYQQRESGRNVPYLSVLQTERKKDHLILRASPTKQQKDLYEFFNMPVDGKKALPKYVLEVTRVGDLKTVVYTRREFRNGLVSIILNAPF